MERRNNDQMEGIVEVTRTKVKHLHNSERNPRHYHQQQEYNHRQHHHQLH